MYSSFSRLAPLGLSLALALGAGCHNEGDEVSPEGRSVEMTEGRAISIELPSDVEREQIHAVAKHVEHSLGGEVAGAKVKVMKDDEDGSANMVIELWGSDLPDQDEVTAGLRQQFAFLADASIAVEELDPEEGPQPEAIDHESLDEDPEVAKQEIIDQLREQGVEGDVDVEVSDGPDGRRVEVKVEEHKEASK
jgi:hypothetical protein